MRCGTVAIVGRTNVGKSTFLNACLGEKIAIVSPLPQTTRDDLLGVVHRPDAQIAFTDTPGFHRPKSELGRRMNQTALDTIRSHDAVVFMTDVAKLSTMSKKHWLPGGDPIHADDRRLLTLLSPDTPAILVLNKVDLLPDKSRMLPLIVAFNEAHAFRSTIPSCMLKEDGADRILSELTPLLPEGEAKFAPDDITDRPATFFVREFVREQVMLTTQREVPHAVAVTVERFEEGKVARIQATIHVEKAGQRIILVGRRGESVKAIGTAARIRLEELLGQQVHLELFIRVTERWKDVPRQLSELGYEHGGGGRALKSLLPEIRTPKTKPKPKAKAAEPPRGKGPRKPHAVKGALPPQRNASAASKGNTSPGMTKGAASPAQKSSAQNKNSAQGKGSAQNKNSAQGKGSAQNKNSAQGKGSAQNKNANRSSAGATKPQAAGKARPPRSPTKGRRAASRTGAR